MPYYLADRGEGLPTSLFGTFIRKGEFLVCPFYEYTLNTKERYAPEDLGFDGHHEYKGKLTEHEALLFLSYGITDFLAVEPEWAAYANASLRKSARDEFDMPHTLRESDSSGCQA